MSSISHLTTGSPDYECNSLSCEEYIEQAHFFQTLNEQLQNNLPAQEVLASVREAVLATTKLPMAIDFLLAELRHVGTFGSAMDRLNHYFTPFQAFVIQESESDRGRFDLRIGLEVLHLEAKYRAGQYQAHEPTQQGIFFYQFETLCRNRLNYDRGFEAMADDPAFDSSWREWILTIRRKIGMVDIADLIYVYSEHYEHLRTLKGPKAQETPKASQASDRDGPVLFGKHEGRIALANRHKDPKFLFSSLQRQLGYPETPRPRPEDAKQALLPQLARRIEQLESRLKLLEEEQRGGFDLTQFYKRPDQEEG